MPQRVTVQRYLQRQVAVLVFRENGYTVANAICSSSAEGSDALKDYHASLYRELQRMEVCHIYFVDAISRQNFQDTGFQISTTYIPDFHVTLDPMRVCPFCRDPSCHRWLAIQGLRRLLNYQISYIHHRPLKHVHNVMFARQWSQQTAGKKVLPSAEPKDLARRDVRSSLRPYSLDRRRAPATLQNAEAPLALQPAEVTAPQGPATPEPETSRPQEPEKRKETPVEPKKSSRSEPSTSRDSQKHFGMKRKDTTHASGKIKKKHIIRPYVKTSSSSSPPSSSATMSKPAKKNETDDDDDDDEKNLNNLKRLTEQVYKTCKKESDAEEMVESDGTF